MQKVNPKTDWKKSLKGYIESRSQRSMPEIDAETDAIFLKLLNQHRDETQKKDPSFKSLPKFYHKTALDESDASLQLKQEAKQRFLQAKEQEILTKEEIEKILSSLRQKATPPNDGKERINYNSFLMAGATLQPKLKHYLSPSTFLKFEKDEYGRVDILPLFHAIVRRINLYQTRL